MKNSIVDPVIIVGLDFESDKNALALVNKLDPSLCRLKVGKAMFTQYGPAFIETLMAKGFEIFLDLKFHDIPHQVGLACRAASALGIWMVNVHALGGKRMMTAAREAIDAANGKKPLLIAVTILTSMTAADISEVGLSDDVVANVLNLASLAKDAGMDGVVSSAEEAKLLRAQLGDDFKLVTPGIRLASDEKGDQRRVVTPVAAMQNGANYLVIGRPITEAKDPLTVIQKINSEII